MSRPTTPAVKGRGIQSELTAVRRSNWEMVNGPPLLYRETAICEVRVRASICVSDLAWMRGRFPRVSTLRWRLSLRQAATVEPETACVKRSADYCGQQFNVLEGGPSDIEVLRTRRLRFVARVHLVYPGTPLKGPHRVAGLCRWRIGWRTPRRARVTRTRKDYHPHHQC